MDQERWKRLETLYHDALAKEPNLRSQTNSGPVSMVTESYLLASSRDFVFKGQTFNLAQLVPHGFTFHTLASNIPLAGAGTFALPLAFTAGGTGVAIGGELSALPKWY